MNEELIHILDKTESLFKRLGIRSVTMDDLSRQLGISKKTLYLYVSSKDDLIQKIVERIIFNEQSYIKNLSQTSEHAIEEHLKIGAYIQEKLADSNPSLLFELQKYHHKSWELLEKHKKSFVYEFVKTNLERGMKEGLYRRDIKTELIAMFYISSTYNFHEPFLSIHNRLIDVHFQLLEYHLRGVVSEKGVKILDDWKRTSIQ